jgi:secreted trypsin-like serine protease
MRAMLRALTLAFLLISSLPAAAMVGGAGAPAEEIARSVVLIVGSRGNSCSGVALAPDLILTAAHCVLPGADYKIVEFDAARQPQLRDIASVTAHPKFDLRAMLAHRATADVALLKLAAPLTSVAPATLSPAVTVAPGDPAMQGERPGLGACTGDSGGPVFAMTGSPAVVGIVSWSTGPANSAGCGGLTGVTPLFLYRDWIVRTVKILRNQL